MRVHGAIYAIWAQNIVGMKNIVAGMWLGGTSKVGPRPIHDLFSLSDWRIGDPHNISPSLLECLTSRLL